MTIPANYADQPIVELERDGVRYTLLGTAHVSKASIDAVMAAIDSGRFDAVVALGAVIRGSTPHFDHVAGLCAKGLAQVSLESALPVAFGVLTVDNLEQAIERAGTKAGNKGAEAALSALEMVNLLRALGT